MTIRLTSVEAFDKVLEKLKQDPMCDEEANALFLKYGVDDIREGLAKNDDEYYLVIDWVPNSATLKVETLINYRRRSDIQTDEEFLTALIADEKGDNNESES